MESSNVYWLDGSLLHKDYWECKCEEQNIWHNSEEACFSCGAERDDQPKAMALLVKNNLYIDVVSQAGGEESRKICLNELLELERELTIAELEH